MNIKFKEGFLEFKDGEYYRKSDGQSFEVDKRFADEVLLPSGVFEAVKEVDPKPKVTKEKK